MGCRKAIEQLVVLQAHPEPNPKVFSYEMCCAGMARHSADSHGETSLEVYDGYCYMFIRKGVVSAKNNILEISFRCCIIVFGVHNTLCK
jgi:hypothetical protein